MSIGRKKKFQSITLLEDFLIQTSSLCPVYYLLSCAWVVFFCSSPRQKWRNYIGLHIKCPKQQSCRLRSWILDTTQGTSIHTRSRAFVGWLLTIYGTVFAKSFLQAGLLQHNLQYKHDWVRQEENQSTIVIQL